MQTLPDAWVLACRYGDVATAGYLEREINWRVARRHRTQPGRQVEEAPGEETTPAGAASTAPS